MAAGMAMALAVCLRAALPLAVHAAPVPGTTCGAFPSDNIWNADISGLPIHPKSAAWLSSTGAGTGRLLHPDFGGPPYGIPFNVVHTSHATTNFNFLYWDQSDPAVTTQQPQGPYPYGSDLVREAPTDSHLLTIDQDTCKLYETGGTDYAGPSTAWSGAIFDLNSNQLRPDGWTSADAAGLPIFPGLVRLDEVQAGLISHAIRFTVQSSDTSYLWPARHQAGTASNPNLPPMGARFRLQANYDISGFGREAQVVLTAMKHYGLIVADNGSNWFFQGTMDAGWNAGPYPTMIAQLKTVPASDFEAVDESSLMVDPNSGQALAPLPRTAVLPAMANAAYGGYTTVTQIQNAGNAPATVSIRYFDSTGAAVGAGDAIAGLPVNATWSVRQDNGHSFATGGAGSASIYSSQPVTTFVNEFAPSAMADATSYTGINPTSGSGGLLFAPAIANSAYGGYTTGIGLVNVGVVPTNVTVVYRDSTGSVVKMQTVNGVGAGGYLGLYSGDPSLGLPAGFAGTATIGSSVGNLAAVVNETGPGGQLSSYDAVPAGSSSLYAPAALNNAYGGYTTGMGIQNTTGAAGTVTINYYDAGGAATMKTFPIAANGYLGVYQGTDIPVAGAYTAKLASTVAIAAIVNEVAPSSTSSQQSTAYNTFPAGSSSLHLPLVESTGADGWSTGEGIMNAGNVPTTVTVSYYDTVTGVAVGTAQTQTLAPHAFSGLYQPTGGLPTGTRATAVITTSSGGQVTAICNESNTTTFMSYDGQ